MFSLLTLCISWNFSCLASSSLRMAAACSSLDSSWKGNNDQCSCIKYSKRLPFRRVLSTHLHRVVEKLVLELLDSEDLLEEVVELLLVEHLVAHHGRRGTLTRPAGLLLWREKVTNYWGSCLSVGKLALVPLYLHFNYHGAAIVILRDSTIMRKRPFASSFQSDESQ